MVIRILIVAGTRLYREGLAQLLSQREELRVIGTRSEGHDAVATLNDIPTDVVLLDMATPDSHTTAREIRLLTPTIPLVAIGIADSDRDVLNCAELGRPAMSRERARWTSSSRPSSRRPEANCCVRPDGRAR